MSSYDNRFRDAQPAPYTSKDIWLNTCNTCGTSNPSKPKEIPEMCVGCGQKLELQHDPEWFQINAQSSQFYSTSQLSAPDEAKLKAARKLRAEALAKRFGGQRDVTG